MQNDLSNYRKTYRKDTLPEENTPEDPLELFREWFRVIDASEHVEEPNAMTLATLGPDGYPKSRIVLLKKYTPEGFIFYTNYQSEKGKAIAANPNVCLSFFWPVTEQQVIVKGTAEKVLETLSDTYFESRPEGSKLGALASEQSKVIPSRKALEEKLEALKAQYRGKTIPRPSHWGGYLVKPVAIEFWQGRANRLHDRIRYTLQKNTRWKKERLSP